MTIRRTALALFCVVSLVYQFPLAYDLLYKPFFNWAPGIDVASTTLLPLALLERGDWTLDEFQGFADEFFRDPYFLAHVNGRTVSRYPVVGAVLALPAYGIPLGTGWMANSGRAWLPYPWTAFMVAKFAAALMAALAAVMLFFSLCELADRRTAAALAMAFALGTSAWSTASQGLWQQTPSLLLQSIGLWFVLRGRRRGALAVAPGAFFFSAATLARPNDGISALLFTLYVLIEYRPAIVRWVALAIPPVLLAGVYNAIYNGSPFVLGYQEGVQLSITGLRLEALLGLFVSPSRGLFVYSPFLILAIPGAWLAWRRGGGRFYLFCAGAVVLGTLFLAAWYYWDGGWGYGTRMMTDVLPYAILLLVPALQSLSHPGRVCFWALAVVAAGLQSLGLWDGGVRWHWHWENYAFDVWDVAENEPLFYVKTYFEMAQHFIARYVH